MSGRLISWLVNGLLVIAVALTLLIVVPAILGYSRAVIAGHSMETAIPYASLAYEETVSVDDLKVGDVITFVPPREYNVENPVTHRIYSITTLDSGQRAFQTKGDNNDERDPWTMTLEKSEQSRVVFHLPYVGYIYIWLSHWWVRFALIVIPLLACAIWIGVVVWREAGREAEEAKQGLAAPGP
jgi:signal peptidase I